MSSFDVLSAVSSPTAVIQSTGNTSSSSNSTAIKPTKTVDVLKPSVPQFALKIDK